MLKGTILFGNHNLSDLRIVRITPTPLDVNFLIYPYIYNIKIIKLFKKY